MSDLKVKIYADGAVLDDMISAYKSGIVVGFTTNPSLMKKAGIQDYNQFAKTVLKEIPDLPISFEVFANDFETMEKEAKKISGFGKNVFVKIPITNSKGESSIPLIKKLSAEGLSLNVTAIFTVDQVRKTVDALTEGTAAIVSVFAGRIADSGRNPLPHMREDAAICHEKKGVELLWASSRELYNVYEADEAGADIITCTPAIIEKLQKVGRPLEELSLNTVQAFNQDIKSLGYSIL